jgi:HPt (histidine-containing phosphotransfer) domain-containing protein
MSDTYPNQDLDLALLNEIADGSDEFIVESIGMFLEQTPELLKLISDYMAQGDWLNAGLTSHKMKANLGFFGMLNTQALIQQVELACKAGGQNPYDIIVKFNQAKSTIATNMITLAKLKAETESRL